MATTQFTLGWGHGQAWPIGHHRQLLMQGDTVPIKPASTLLLISLALLYGSAALAQDQYFLEQDGIVVFEAESTDAVEGWESRVEIDDYLGNSYLQWEGPNYFPLQAAGRSTLTYHVRIETPGNYQMRWRNRIATGELTTKHNDSWVRFPQGANIEGQHPLDGWTKVYMNRLGDWTWDAKTVDHVGNPIRQYLGAGDHVFEISGRSAGHAIDRVALYRYEEVNFNQRRFNEMPESPRVDASGIVVDPTPPITPVEPDPEPVNLLAIDTPEDEAGQCVGKSITLVASRTAAHAAGQWLSDENLEIDANAQGFMHFDLKHVPVVESAVLDVTVIGGAAASQLKLALGSDSHWALADDVESAAAPYAAAELAVASGRWEDFQRYRISLDPSLMVASNVSFLLATDEELELAGLSDPEAAPRLTLSGSAGFCDLYAATKLAAETPVVVPVPETLVEPEPEPEPEPETETAPQPEPEPIPQPVAAEKPVNSTSDSGGASSWWLLAGLFTLAGLRHRYPTGRARSVI